MNRQKDNVAHSASVLGVENMHESKSFYEKVLGFKTTFEWEDPPSYAVLKRGDSSIHLALREKAEVINAPVVYIFCHDIESLYDELKDSGEYIIEVLSQPTDYGMREFLIRDNTGHKLVFGSGLVIE